MEIFKESNLSVFKLVSFNREINKQNIKRLLNLTKQKNQLHLFPIVVDKDMNVIDGQHRLEVAKQLCCPIYYIKTSDSATPEGIYNLNSAGKKHSLEDKVTMLAKSGNASAIEIIELYKKFLKKIKIGGLLETVYFDRSKKSIEKLVKGVPLDNSGVKLAGLIAKHLPESACQSKTCRSIVLILKTNPQIKMESFFERLSKNWQKVIIGDEFTIKRTLIEAYNLNLAAENRAAMSL